MGENATRLDKYADAVARQQNEQRVQQQIDKTVRAVMAVADAEQAELRAEAEAWRAMRDAIQKEVDWPVSPMLSSDIFVLAKNADRFRDRAKAAEDKLARVEALAVAIERDASVWGNPRDLHVTPSAVRRAIVGRLRATLDGTSSASSA